jgi:hypothetical protein
MKFVRGAVLAMLTPAILASACTSDGPPEPPAPEVSTVEFEQRLDEHLSRFASFLQPDVRVSAPIRSRAQGCAGAPSWAVVPRAEVTVQAGGQAGQLFENLQDWIGRNGFDGPDLYPGNDRDVQGRHTDGTQVVVHRDDGAPQFTVTVTGPCTWPPDRAGAPASGQLAALPKPAKPVSILDSVRSDIRVDPRVCLSPKVYVYNDSAPAFTGRGPHPMVMSVSGGEQKFLHSELYLPGGWEPEDKHKAQLVVCVQVTTIGKAGRKVSCNYTDLSLPSLGPLGDDGSPFNFQIFKSTYQFTVRTARNGAVVKTFTLPGTVSDEDSCPFRMEGYLKPLARGLDDKALERALRSLHQSPR